MKLFKKSYDGGPDSGVTGYWLFEIKPVASVVLLHFSPGSRDAFHSHAFSAVTLWLKGKVEELYFPHNSPLCGVRNKFWKPGRLKFTPKGRFHKILAKDTGAWAISFRGPWADSWQEFKKNRIVNLTHGRVEI